MHPPELPGVTHRYHDLATGLRAHVAHAGDESEPPLIALHGFPQHWYEWRRLIERLAGEFHILAMDLRGLGWTSKAPDRDYRKATIAADVIALLDALGIERAGARRHDWGGWVGWHAVLDHPERFTGYVATGIVHPWNPPQTLLREAPRFLVPAADRRADPRPVADPERRHPHPARRLGRPRDLRPRRRADLRRRLPRQRRQPLLPPVPRARAAARAERAA